jgi:hypothetical protein
MKKMFVAAAVLVLAGVAVAGAVHVKNSLESGVCPLTGRPIAHHKSTPCDATTGFAVSVSSDGAAPSAAAEEETICPVTRRHCESAGRGHCDGQVKQCEPAPAARSTENP